MSLFYTFQRIIKFFGEIETDYLTVSNNEIITLGFNRNILNACDIRPPKSPVDILS